MNRSERGLVRINVIDDNGDRGLCEFYPKNALKSTLFNTTGCPKRFWHIIFIFVHFDMLHLKINTYIHWNLIVISYVFCYLVIFQLVIVSVDIVLAFKSWYHLGILWYEDCTVGEVNV